MKKIKEGEEFEMAGTIFTYTKDGNSIKLKVERRSEAKPRTPKGFIPPTIDEVKAFFKAEGFSEALADTFFRGYDVAGWKDSNDKQIKNWRQKAIQVWFKKNEKEKTDPNKITFFQK